MLLAVTFAQPLTQFFIDQPRPFMILCLSIFLSLFSCHFGCILLNPLLWNNLHVYVVMHESLFLKRLIAMHVAIITLHARIYTPAMSSWYIRTPVLQNSSTVPPTHIASLHSYPSLSVWVTFSLYFVSLSKATPPTWLERVQRQVPHLVRLNSTNYWMLNKYLRNT